MKSWEIGKVIYDKFGNVVGQFVVTNPNIRNTTNFVSYGGFISTGFEFGKFRLAAKYVLIPSKAHTLYRYNYNTQSLTGEFITERFRNNYMSISVGFYIGGGNRKKAAAIQASKRTVQPAQERLTPNEREKTATLEREKPAETAQSPVSNTRVELVDSVLLITYNLEAKSDIELHISIDNGERFIGPMQLVSGAVGKGIEPENNKIMMWEIVEEIGLMDFSNVVVRVVATERR
jgi:hypothetical protein